MTGAGRVQPQSEAYVPCAAEDYPVWADGSQERMVCEKKPGHDGPHSADAGWWSWSVDARGPLASGDPVTPPASPPSPTDGAA